ncbi:MAG: NusA-like transcription termination signal-binding factor [Nitrosopumilus sp.]|nr:NusA-like transcription termination signal-binding factor [Nitrosopumilus sp.]MDA7941847.1 NusA-like transcription termination signal-binding factor [Nitrosopumilus sp.]MDA7943441.1 NusA-like transcription termination signal-binding factor [Nitrosopumilus sp.]MDA7945384.1 NusA-like transcription termination signal-binding factor [Nitrosopumilus sp.]MDA7953050.1 NusA-like transcription termination signal-binding factor [Nitrosopumilus sp.]
MKQSIKITSDQMRLLALFDRVTHASARDCIEDEKQDRVTFVVEPGMMGRAIGKGGANIKSLEAAVGRSVDLVEFDEDPARFIAKLFGPKLVLDSKLDKRHDGSAQVILYVDPMKKGLVVGREGRNAERARMLARRYFGIDKITISTREGGA